LFQSRRVPVRVCAAKAAIDAILKLQDADGHSYQNHLEEFGMKNVLLSAIAVCLVSMPLGTSQVRAAKVCSQVEMPVCAVKPDGSRQTYTNSGCAKADRAHVLHKDACYGPICAMWFNPTCARDPGTHKPKLYPSACEAENANAPLLNPKACPKPKT
jgi:hypothetical protein